MLELKLSTNITEIIWNLQSVALYDIRPYFALQLLICNQIFAFKKYKNNFENFLLKTVIIPVNNNILTTI